MLRYCQLDTFEQTSVKFNWSNATVYIAVNWTLRNKFESIYKKYFWKCHLRKGRHISNDISKSVAILSQPQCSVHVLSSNQLSRATFSIDNKTTFFNQNTLYFKFNKIKNIQSHNKIINMASVITLDNNLYNKNAAITILQYHNQRSSSGHFLNKPYQVRTVVRGSSVLRVLFVENMWQTKCI